jgi:hypothetical protein
MWSPGRTHPYDVHTVTIRHVVRMRGLNQREMLFSTTSASTRLLVNLVQLLKEIAKAHAVKWLG